jgi:hypothetical protein
MPHHDNDQLVNAIKEINYVHFENHTTPINTLGGQNAEPVNAVACAP